MHPAGTNSMALAQLALMAQSNFACTGNHQQTCTCFMHACMLTQEAFASVPLFSCCCAVWATCVFVWLGAVFTERTFFACCTSSLILIQPALTLFACGFASALLVLPFRTLGALFRSIACCEKPGCACITPVARKILCSSILACWALCACLARPLSKLSSLHIHGHGASQSGLGSKVSETLKQQGWAAYRALFTGRTGTTIGELACIA